MDAGAMFGQQTKDITEAVTLQSVEGFRTVRNSMSAVGSGLCVCVWARACV